MISRIKMLFVCAILCMVVASSAGDHEMKQQSLWESGKGGYHTYRIPALVVTTNGTL
jgi:hypothetical protein